MPCRPDYDIKKPCLSHLKVKKDTSLGQGPTSQQHPLGAARRAIYSCSLRSTLKIDPSEGHLFLIFNMGASLLAPPATLIYNLLRRFDKCEDMIWRVILMWIRSIEPASVKGFFERLKLEKERA